MNRRSFLKIAFAAGVAAALPVSLIETRRHPLPTIWGDGVHDDTAGMQAAINGEPFYAVDDCVRVVNGVVCLAPATYSVKTIILPREI